METERIQVNLAPGMSKAELIIREGEAPMQLAPKAPVKTNITGVIGTIAEYLEKRIDKGQFDQKDCHILVNRDKVEITLITNESDEYRRGQVIGKLAYNPKFIEFGINSDKVWTPTELGMFIKMNRAFFPDRKVNMDLVTSLMNFTADVNHKIERAIRENGNRTDNFAQVVNSNLPESFIIRMPLFKGMQPETIEVETFAQVNGRDVAFILISPGAQVTLEDLRDRVIDEQLSRIREIAPEIAIIEV